MQSSIILLRNSNAIPIEHNLSQKIKGINRHLTVIYNTESSEDEEESSIESDGVVTDIQNNQYSNDDTQTEEPEQSSN